MSRTTTCERYRIFKDGRTSIEDGPRLGQCSTSTDNDSIERVRAVIRSDRWFNSAGGGR
jgi:hypothetical protein